MTVVELLGQLEHGMIAAHGIPVRVMWSFGSCQIECVRLDGHALTPTMRRTFSTLWTRVRPAVPT